MRANVWIAGLVVLVLFCLGFALLFFTGTVRSFYFENFKQGVEKTGFGVPWLDNYPGIWFFRLFGLISITFGVAIIILILSPK